MLQPVEMLRKMADESLPVGSTRPVPCFLYIYSSMIEPWTRTARTTSRWARVAESRAALPLFSREQLSRVLAISGQGSPKLLVQIWSNSKDLKRSCAWNEAWRTGAKTSSGISVAGPLEREARARERAVGVTRWFTPRPSQPLSSHLGCNGDSHHTPLIAHRSAVASTACTAASCCSFLTECVRRYSLLQRQPDAIPTCSCYFSLYSHCSSLQLRYDVHQLNCSATCIIDSGINYRTCSTMLVVVRAKRRSSTNMQHEAYLRESGRMFISASAARC